MSISSLRAFAKQHGTKAVLLLSAVCAPFLVSELYWLSLWPSVTGLTVGSGADAKIFLKTGLPQRELQKAVAHETVHYLYAHGDIKRDLAGLFVAQREWEEWGFQPSAKAKFQNGLNTTADRREILASIDQYLQQYEGGKTNPRMIGMSDHLAFGLMVRLCEQDSDCVAELIYQLFQGKSAGYAYEQTRFLEQARALVRLQIKKEGESISHQTVAWARAHLILHERKSNGTEFLRDIEEGRALFRAGERDRLRERLNEVLETKGVGDDGTLVWYWGAVLAGLLLERFDGDHSKAIDELAKSLKENDDSAFVSRLTGLRTPNK